METESEGTKSLWETHALVDDISWHVIFLGIQKFLNQFVLKIHLLYLPPFSMFKQFWEVSEAGTSLFILVILPVVSILIIQETNVPK